jgi:GWxTD domain-containing protein
MEPSAYPTQKISFFRWNPGEANEYARLTVDPRWVEILGEGEDLRRSVSALYPIASQTERMSIESLSQKDAADSLRWRFTQQFWTKRHPSDALAQAAAYTERVAEVNKKFSSKAVPGYATDRGRIYLQYGPPTLAERRPYENDAYPYEMWQYNTLDVPNSPYQINKIFIFGNFDLAGGNYELIHSSAIGEIQNPRWRITLQKRSYITGDLDQTGANDGEKFGSRLYNNMFFQSGGNN